MTLNDIYIKTFKMNSRKYFVLFLCSSLAIALFFMYTTIYLNNDINREITRSLKDILTAILIAIVLFTVCFFNYAYTSLLKSRNSEFGLLMSLGITVRELSWIVFIENIIIVVLSSFFGLLSGTIFSKIFFLGVIKVLKAYYINYDIGTDNYLMTIGIFLMIYICVICIKNRKLKKLDVIELMASDKEGESLNLYQPLLGLLGIGLILVAFAIVYFAAVGVLDDPEKSSHFTILCFTGLYFTIAQLGNLYLELSRKFRRYYIRNLLSITELNYKLSQNKDMIYILTLLVSITLFFLGYAYSKYVIAKVEDGNFLVFITSFLAVLFFFSSVSVIYFKLFSEVDEERIRYHKLNCIGITHNEVARYISCELAILLFLPIVLGMLMVYPYLSIEYINSMYKDKVLFSLITIFMIYCIFQLIFYMIIKRKYIELILQE